MRSSPISPAIPLAETDPGRSVHLLDDARQLQLLMQSVVDYAIYMLDPQGHIASWNVGGHRIKGYEPEEVIGRHFSMFYTEEDIASGLPERALKKAQEEGRFENEGWRRRKDGTLFWASVVIDPVFVEGRLIGFAKVTRDITDRHLAQQALEEAQRAMLQSQKMEAIGQLTYGLAHDFNNLLTVITNSLDSILMTTDPHRVRKSVLTAQRAADRGALLTRQLLAFSRGQWLRPKPHDVNTLIRGAEDVLRRAVDETVQIELDLHPRLPEVSVDGPQLEAALLNLVVNARDALPKGGLIRIVTRSEGTDVPFVSIVISDNGTGMSPEVVARAAEPFFTTKEIGKGSGLGLSQVYGFVTQSNGRLDIASEPGAGTTVTLRLPAICKRRGGTSAQPPRILVVDDDTNIVEIVRETLLDAGFDVLVAFDGPSALDLLRSHAIDVLFSDAVMPGGMSGPDLARHALSAHPDIRVVLASGYSEGWLKDIPEQCEFVAKPYRAAQILQMLVSPPAHHAF